MKNFALIGCGQLGRTHAECLTKIDGVRFVTYADVHLEAAEKLLADFGGERATDEVGVIFEDPAIDAVYICTQHDSHAKLCIQAARAGKHILVEKPLALNLKDCEAIAAEVEAAGVWLMPAFKLRYYPLLQMAKDFVPHPQVMVGQMMDARWEDDLWAQDPVKGGANVHAQGCHTTDILRYLSGSEPESLWAAGGAISHLGHPCPDQCVASIRFQNGSVASWIQGDAATGPFTSKFFIELFGEGRSVQLYDRFKKATFWDGEKSWVEEQDNEEGFLLENREFVRALTEGRPPEISSRDGIQATRIVLAADAAIRSGEVQRFL